MPYEIWPLKSVRIRTSVVTGADMGRREFQRNRIAREKRDIEKGRGLPVAVCKSGKLCCFRQNNKCIPCRNRHEKDPISHYDHHLWRPEE